MLIVGIDMAKSKFDVGLWLNQKGESRGEFSNNQGGYELLQGKLEQACDAEEEIKLIIEPTGGYEMGLILYALEQGWASESAQSQDGQRLGERVWLAWQNGQA